MGRTMNPETLAALSDEMAALARAGLPLDRAPREAVVLLNVQPFYGTTVSKLEDGRLELAAGRPPTEALVDRR